jgi:glycosyltransferase involved in cell wall biosynthesis
VVIGDGPDLPALRRQAGQAGLAGNVTFLGWRHDVGSLIPLLDALLLPSHFEGLPQTALQAATARVPVVAYGVDGLNDFLPSEFLIRHGDETGMATAVSDLVRGTRVWPAEAMARRAADWGDPQRAAERLLELLRGGGA